MLSLVCVCVDVEFGACVGVYALSLRSFVLKVRIKQPRSIGLRGQSLVVK